MAGQSRIGVRRRRRPTTFRLKKTPWIDPNPGIPGTEPEKRLFDALLRRHVYFVFQGELQEFHEKDLPVPWQVGYKPDFVLPEYKVIIDPFGIYHHSLEEAVKRDYMKSIIYRAVGYSFYHPWWGNDGWEWIELTRSRGIPGDQLTAQRVKRSLRAQGAQDRARDGSALTSLGYDTFAVLDRIPELRQGIRFPLKHKQDIEAKRMRGYRLGKNLGLGASSVAAANRKRKKPPSLTLRTRGRKRSRRPTR